MPQTSSALIYRVAIAVPIPRLFDYLPLENCQAQLGARLLVPFGRQQKVGYLIEIHKDSDFDIGKLKKVIHLIDESSLLEQIDRELLYWASRYYHHPLGEVMSSAFPIALRKGKPAVSKTDNYYGLSALGEAIAENELKRAPQQLALLLMLRQGGSAMNSQQLKEGNPNWRASMKALMAKKLVIISAQPSRTANPSTIIANSHQLTAITQVQQNIKKFSVYLLQGVTGSGKTEVYMQLIEQVVEQGQQVMVLLPEITLTPQLQQRFKLRFSVGIVISHSGLSEGERLNSWLAMQQGSASILLGTRSALFTPCPKLGLMILDEEHDSSFKQQKGFRFSARDVTIVRAKMSNIPIILGTATPALESLHNVNQQRYQLLNLPERAGNAIPPKFILFDIKNQRLQQGFSNYLITEIKQT